jgi:muramidase (phage lysozyme)
MAPFNPGLNPTNDPNYLNASRGYSKSDVPVDTSLGTLFGNVGTMVGEGASAVDTAIQTNLRADITAAVNPIRDAAGANLTPDETIAVAGTGARGAKYSAAVGAGLTPDDLAAGNASVPDGVTRNMNGLNRLTAAYKSGQLSDTHYYAQLESVVKDMKQRYPGYQDQVDAMVSQITGVNPANALRRAVLMDMNSMAAASNSAANKIQTQFNTDAKYIQTIHPGMDVNAYAANKNAVDVEVGQLKARDYGIQAEEAQLGLMDKRDARAGTVAAQTFTNRANYYVSSFVSGAINSLKNKSEALLSQGANANPKDVQNLVNQYQALRSVISTNLDQMASKPLDSNGNSYMTYMKPEQLKAIKDQTLAPLDTIVQNLGIDAAHTGVANAAANILKNRNSQDMLKIEDKFPAARAINVMGKMVGPQGSSILLQKSQALPEMSRAIANTAWMTIADKENPNIPMVSDALNAHGPNLTGKVATVTVKGVQTLAQNPDPEIASRAVTSLYGDQKFFANVSPADKTALYKSLTSPDFTQKMITLGKTNPAALNAYEQWVTTNAVPVYKQAVDDLQQASEYNRYNVTFDPKTNHFVAVTKPEFSNPVRGLASPTGAPFDPAGNQVAKVNELSDRIMPVLKAQYGDQAPQKFMQILQASGYNPNAPQHGTWLEGLGGAVSNAFKSAGQALSISPEDANPFRQQPQAPVTDKQSSVEDIQKTVAGAESGGNYNAVFGHKASEFPLTQMSVSEVRGLQKMLVAHGAESSAAGAYQVLGKTLDGLIKSGVVNPNDQFDEKTQDKIAQALIEKRGLSDYESGKISKEEFLNRLSQEWAGLPTTSGRSYYEGVGSNHATISVPKAMAMFLKKKFKFDFSETSNG